MGWKIVDGQPQRARVAEVKIVLPPSEVEILFHCLTCGKSYKTENGRDKHLTSHG